MSIGLNGKVSKVRAMQLRDFLERAEIAQPYDAEEWQSLTVDLIKYLIKEEEK